MTPSRLATATLLLAGLALPALAQGTATTTAATPMTGTAVAGAPAAKVGTATPTATSSTAATGTSTPAAPGGAMARATPEAAKPGAATEARPHAEAAPVHGAMRSHRRLASASRMDRAGTTHATSGEVAPATTR